MKTKFLQTPFFDALMKFAQPKPKGIRGVVSSVRVMKRGTISVVTRYAIDERDQALKLMPGQVVTMTVSDK